MDMGIIDIQGDTEIWELLERLQMLSKMVNRSKSDYGIEVHSMPFYTAEFRYGTNNMAG